MSAAVRRGVARRRLGLAAGTLLTVSVLAVALVSEGRLRCADPWVDARSPDRTWTLTVCRRPMLFAMPGGSGDAPGWIVLRDADGAIRGVAHLEMMQLLGETGAVADLRWDADRVVLPFLAGMPLVPASGAVARWLGDRVWRLRAWSGLVPADAMSAR